MDLKSSAEKETILHDEYHIDITRDMREELRKMGGLMEPAVEVAVEVAVDEAKKETLLENIRNAMESWDLTAEAAMKGLKISEEKQKELLPLI